MAKQTRVQTLCKWMQVPVFAIDYSPLCDMMYIMDYILSFMFIVQIWKQKLKQLVIFLYKNSPVCAYS